MTFRTFVDHARAIFPPRAQILPLETLASRRFPALQFSLPDFLKGIKTQAHDYFHDNLLFSLPDFLKGIKTTANRHTEVRQQFSLPDFLKGIKTQ
jgi:hypothetical protein